MDEEDDHEEDLDLDVIRQTMYRLWDTKDYTTKSSYRYIKVRTIYVAWILYFCKSKQSDISNDITVYNIEKDITLSYTVFSGVSDVESITTGVPQGTVLGPLTTLLQKHNIHHHLYADDTQLYITFPPTDHTQALARMEACVQDAKAWLCDNGLVMNDNKSQAIVIRSSSLRTPTSLTRVNICGQLVDISPVIRDLGFTIDSNLTMTSQVASVCRSA